MPARLAGSEGGPRSPGDYRPLATRGALLAIGAGGTQ